MGTSALPVTMKSSKQATHWAPALKMPRVKTRLLTCEVIGSIIVLFKTQKQNAALQLFILINPLDVRANFRYRHYLISIAQQPCLYNPKSGDAAFSETSAISFPQPPREERGNEGPGISKDRPFCISCYRFKGVISMLLRTAVQSLREAFTPGVSVPGEVHSGRLCSSNPLSEICSLPS